MSDAVSLIVEGGEEKVILSSGEEVIIKVCNGRTLPLILKFGRTLTKDLNLKLSEIEGGASNILLSRLDDLSFAFELAEKYTEQVYDLVAALTSLPSTDAVADLPVDDLLAVAQKIIKVNKDFFIKRVLPLLGKESPST